MRDRTSFAVTTPMWDSEPLSRALGLPVHLKMEALQPCGSFKIRGLGRVCAARVAGGCARRAATPAWRSPTPGGGSLCR